MGDDPRQITFLLCDALPCKSLCPLERVDVLQTPFSGAATLVPPWTKAKAEEMGRVEPGRARAQPHQPCEDPPQQDTRLLLRVPRIQRLSMPTR